MATVAKGEASGKVPWIKSGDAYLNPDEVRVFYASMVYRRSRAGEPKSD